jgi:hypothetical protein
MWRPEGSANSYRLTPRCLISVKKEHRLPCKVRLLSLKLGLDPGFHVGYQTDIQLRDFIGEGDVLTVVFRVVPNNNANAPLYFRQKWQVPAIPEDAKGAVTLEGNFIAGPGDYHVDWLIRDRRDRACSAYWRISVRLPAGKGQLFPILTPAPAISPASEVGLMRQPAQENAERGWKAAILIHVDSQRPGAGGTAAR